MEEANAGIKDTVNPKERKRSEWWGAVVLEQTQADPQKVVVEKSGGAVVIPIPGFTVQAVTGPDTGAAAESVDGRITIGTAEGTVLRLTDPTVSRYHVQLESTSQGVVVKDLGSPNRTLLGGVVVREAALTHGAELQ